MTRTHVHHEEKSFATKCQARVYAYVVMALVTITTIRCHGNWVNGVVTACKRFLMSNRVNISTSRTYAQWLQGSYAIFNLYFQT